MSLLTPVLAKVSPNVTQMIRIDHAAVVALFHKVRPDQPEGVRAAAARSICLSLEIHAQLEEEIFYPAVRDAGIDSPVLEMSVPEHDEMRRLIARVRELQAQPAERDQAVRELMSAVMHHVADEETQLLAAAERQMSPKELETLGGRMSERRLVLMKPHLGEMAGNHARAMPMQTAVLAMGAVAIGALLFGRRGTARTAYARRW